MVLIHINTRESCGKVTVKRFLCLSKTTSRTRIHEIFLFTTASRTAVGTTQSPTQWVPEILSLGVKRPGREADHSPPSSADIKE
jgi:hypothetical protein